jgi:cytochrome c-type biogenesis protein CcmH/NrfG
LKRNPSNAEYLAELGHVYIELGFKLRAKSAFEKAMHIDPYNKRADEGLRIIKQHFSGW